MNEEAGPDRDKAQPKAMGQVSAALRLEPVSVEDGAASFPPCTVTYKQQRMDRGFGYDSLEIVVLNIGSKGHNFMPAHPLPGLWERPGVWVQVTCLLDRPHHVCHHRSHPDPVLCD